MTKEFEWKTEDGRVYPVSLMTDEHLYNAYRHTQRRTFEGILEQAKKRGIKPELLDDKVRAFWEEKKQNTLDAFQQEATRRGLGELF